MEVQQMPELVECDEVAMHSSDDVGEWCNQLPAWVGSDRI